MSIYLVNLYACNTSKLTTIMHCIRFTKVYLSI